MKTNKVRRRAQSIADGLISGTLPGRAPSADYKIGFVEGFITGHNEPTIQETRWQLIKRVFAARETK